MDQVKALLWTVGEHSPRDYVILKLMTMFGLSVGEVVGSDPRGWNKETKTWFAKEPDIPGLTFAPINEQGVILLFGILSHDLKFSVERIRQEYPDAAVIDYRDDPNRGIKKDIEFEFLSSNFSKQKHPIEKMRYYRLLGT